MHIRNEGHGSRDKGLAVLSGILICCMFMMLAGCGPQFKKKFVRKKAEKNPEQVFAYDPQQYQREPNDVLYKKHFIFWKAWQEELIYKLGTNRAGDLRNFQEALKHLDDMKSCLSSEKASELDTHTQALRSFYENYKARDFDVIRSRQMRQDLDRLMLKIDKIFRYNKVKEYIR